MYVYDGIRHFSFFPPLMYSGSSTSKFSLWGRVAFCHPGIWELLLGEDYRDMVFSLFQLLSKGILASNEISIHSSRIALPSIFLLLWYPWKEIQAPSLHSIHYLRSDGACVIVLHNLYKKTILRLLIHFISSFNYCFSLSFTNMQFPTDEPTKSVLCIDNLLSPEPSKASSAEKTVKKTSVKKLKEKRKRATPEQLAVLNKVFSQTSFPSTEMRLQLGKQLGMKPRTVQIWFQNRRQALRTRSRTMMQQQLPPMLSPTTTAEFHASIPSSPPLSPPTPESTSARVPAPALPRLCCVLDNAYAYSDVDNRLSPVILPSPASTTTTMSRDDCYWSIH